MYCGMVWDKMGVAFVAFLNVYFRIIIRWQFSDNLPTCHYVRCELREYV